MTYSIDLADKYQYKTSLLLSDGAIDSPYVNLIFCKHTLKLYCCHIFFC